MRNNARNIGRILTLQGQYDEALPWIDRAVAISINRVTAEDPGLEGMESQRAWVLFRLGRRAEALEAVTAAVSVLERMKNPNDGYALAFSRVLRGRILIEMGRPGEAEPQVRAALVWFERWGRDHPSYADAECELGRARMLQAPSPRDRPRSSGACLFIEPGVKPTAK